MMLTSRVAITAAQAGPQTLFLGTPADIAIYGGAAGAGKTFALLMEALRHVGRVRNFTVVIFRRTMPQIMNPGGLWDETLNLPPGWRHSALGRPGVALAARWQDQVFA